MQTIVLKTEQATSIRRAAAVLRRGGLVCHPTDTVYGVAANALLPDAVARLYVVKERPRDRAIPLLLGDASDVERLARDIPDLAYRLMQQFWPGGLTIVLRAQPHIPDIVTAGSGSVALRLPDHVTPRALARELGAPLAATSANLSGRPSPRTAADVLADLNGRVEMVLDGGPCPGGVDSTVIDVTCDPPRVLRTGAIAVEALRAAWQQAR